MRTISLLSVLSLAACTGAPLSGDRNPTVFYGSEADRPEHEAVVALLQRDGHSIEPEVICTGTLIGDRLVATSANCVDWFGADPGGIAVYLGDAPGEDDHFLDTIYTVSAVATHPDWDDATWANDLAVLRLGNAPAETTQRIAPLPPELGLDDEDLGQPVDIAGYGVDEDDGYGVKQHVEVPLAGFGCESVDGCYGGVTDRPDTEVAFLQPGQPANGGACDGDFGGPLFLERGGTVYLAGVVSWTDQTCRILGIGTRADAYAEFLADPFGPAGGFYPEPFGPGMGLVINEVMANPPGSDETTEWVEIVSLDTEPIDTRGWELVDGSGRFLPLPETVLEAGDVLLVEGRLGLNNGGDRLELFGAGPGDAIAWETAPEGISLNKEQDLSQASLVVPHHTVDGASAASSPGTRVDGTPFLD